MLKIETTPQCLRVENDDYFLISSHLKGRLKGSERCGAAEAAAPLQPRALSAA